MNTDLKQAIDRFLEAQERACCILAEVWNMPRPITALEWVDWRMRFNGKKELRHQGDYHIRPHGYGVEFKSKEFTIDFDFGKKGESDGFDSYRLFYFLEDNNIKTIFKTEEGIEKAIDIEVKKGNIIYSGYINYYIND